MSMIILFGSDTDTDPEQIAATTMSRELLRHYGFIHLHDVSGIWDRSKPKGYWMIRKAAFAFGLLLSPKKWPGAAHPSFI